MMNKLTFKVTENDVEIELAVKRPTAKQERDAQVQYNMASAAALKGGALLRKGLERYLIEQNIWDQDKQEEYESLQKHILDAEKTLKRGGLCRSEAKAMAIQLLRDRTAFRNLIHERNAADSITVESQGEEARFGYLVSVCTVYNDTNAPVFNSYDDYLDQGRSEKAFAAATNFSKLYYGLDPNFEAKLTEYVVLKKLGYLDDELRLINSDGHLVDLADRLIDDQGRYVDKDGNFVDIDGNPVNEDGDLVEETLPFLEDDGQPIE